MRGRGAHYQRGPTDTTACRDSGCSGPRKNITSDRGESHEVVRETRRERDEGWRQGVRESGERRQPTRVQAATRDGAGERDARELRGSLTNYIELRMDGSLYHHPGTNETTCLYTRTARLYINYNYIYFPKLIVQLTINAQTYKNTSRYS